ncbi:Hypothetical protein ETEE_1959 [Edwardsiella anguillarum ET080813]|uniref:Uncharacterized protein n=1 Tax=Edwardsiella anguillarum ET080813 TaxID=667120 RepID=A0A076LIJ4_9GAMM|nr:Hypothetical protein ETEE_1959 [Edwardsiella anguillarum ET080813]
MAQGADPAHRRQARAVDGRPRGRRTASAGEIDRYWAG